MVPAASTRAKSVVVSYRAAIGDSPVDLRSLEVQQDGNILYFLYTAELGVVALKRFHDG